MRISAVLPLAAGFGRRISVRIRHYYTGGPTPPGLAIRSGAGQETRWLSIAWASKDKSWLTMIPNSYPPTGMAPVVRRYRRSDLGHLELEMTVADPGAFKKLWIMKRTPNLDPAGEVMETSATRRT